MLIALPCVLWRGKRAPTKDLPSLLSALPCVLWRGKRALTKDLPSLLSALPCALWRGPKAPPYSKEVEKNAFFGVEKGEVAKLLPQVPSFVQVQ